MAHGAGMSNIAFAKSGAKVIEIFPEGFYKNVYKDMADLKNVDYKELVLTPQETIYNSKFPIHTTDHSRQSNLVINTTKFGLFLEDYL